MHSTRMFNCKHCGKTFKCEKSVQEHVRRSCKEVPEEVSETEEDGDDESSE